MEKLLPFIEIAAYGSLAILILATFIARLTKTTKDDILLGKAEGVISKVLSYLPTFGINPRTKALKEALEDIKKMQKPEGENASDS